jgi:hypothetical protein
VHHAAHSKSGNSTNEKTTTMKTTLKLALITLAFAAFPVLAQDTKPKMKATKECASCCKQGGDCCNKCGPDKCAPCCDKKAAPPKK